ncbi:hypothetical protein BJ742DRAFT_876531 [Cladochytrium replicatum]|nr:hypothetical protein BJ742DRAFT_876531 [Cladochytrium replicatum]
MVNSTRSSNNNSGSGTPNKENKDLGTELLTPADVIKINEDQAQAQDNPENQNEIQDPATDETDLADDPLDASDTGAGESSHVHIFDHHEVKYQEEKARKKALLEQQLRDPSKAPSSYLDNSKKETLILQYVVNFNRQYSQLYPGRKELLLSPKNEFSVQKFVCTTIRPTQLPFKETYDYRSCARFVSDFLTYSPLDPPHELPTFLPSPTYTLKLQTGNSFDYSVLLVSLLQGVGYDAYVVSGYATKEITLMDETKTQTSDIGLPPPKSHQTSKADSGQEGEKSSTSKYKVKPSRFLKSVFLQKQEEKRIALEQKQLEEQRLMEEKRKAAQIEDDDELKGLRVHSWVLMLPGKREISEAFFIEPATGRLYSTENEKYLGVESVFSSANYWVNMQTCYDGLKGISFDLGDNAKWEFVLLDNTLPGGIAPKIADDIQVQDNASEEDEDEENGSEILDLPPSWVSPLSITKDEFELRSASGSKSVTYRNGRWEKFAEYHRPDGMISRITFFIDESAGFQGEIQEEFENRSDLISRDKLCQRTRVPAINKVSEYFDAGRPHGLKEHVMVNGKTTDMHFYASARSDGLFKRVETANKIMEHFVDREDKLIYRSVTFDTSEEDENSNKEPTTGTSHILKMAEKFEKNPDLPVHEDVAKKTYFVRDERIRVVYQLGPNRIVSSWREFKKPATEQPGAALELVNSFEVDVYAKPLKRQHLYAQLCQLLKSEQACLQAHKNSEREVREILQARQAEEKDITLIVSVYDTIRNNGNLPNEQEREPHKGEEEESKSANLDYLSPYLVNYENSTQLSKEEALTVKEAYLKGMKERLVEKANIIQSRLDEVTAEYQRRQLMYSKNADLMSVEETEEYMNFCNEALFKIHILEKRLAKHKESAPERYAQMDARLRADSRLQPAFN